MTMYDLTYQLTSAPSVCDACVMLGALAHPHEVAGSTGTVPHLDNDSAEPRARRVGPEAAGWHGAWADGSRVRSPAKAYVCLCRMTYEIPVSMRCMIL